MLTTETSPFHLAARYLSAFFKQQALLLRQRHEPEEAINGTLVALLRTRADALKETSGPTETRTLLSFFAGCSMAFGSHADSCDSPAAMARRARQAASSIEYIGLDTDPGRAMTKVATSLRRSQAAVNLAVDYVSRPTNPSWYATDLVSDSVLRDLLLSFRDDCAFFHDKLVAKMEASQLPHDTAKEGPINRGCGEGAAVPKLSQTANIEL